MAIYNKYEKYQKYVNGVPQDEYKQGDLIGLGDYNSKEDCEHGALYKWVDLKGETVCDGYDLYLKTLRYKSLNLGETWEPTDVYGKGQLIEQWSTECGVVIKYRWTKTGVVKCDGWNKSEEYIKLVSHNMGYSWEDVEPKQYKYEVTEVMSKECIFKGQPFEFTFDAGEEGAALNMNITVDSLYSYWAEIYREPLDTGRTLVHYEGLAVTIARIDWGDGQVEDIDDSLRVVKETTYGLEELIDPFATTPTYNEHKLPKLHVYRTGGIKTIKIWGNITYLFCKLMKDLIHWGAIYETWAMVSSVLMEFLMNRVTIEAAKPNEAPREYPITGAKTEGAKTNFLENYITVQGDHIGNMRKGTFWRTKILDISNSPNITFLNPFSDPRAIREFKAENCANLTYFNLKLSDPNYNTLEKFSFKNCPKLQEVPSEIYMKPSSRMSLTEALQGCNNITSIVFKGNIYCSDADLRKLTQLTKMAGNMYVEGDLLCTNITKLTDIKDLTLDCHSANFSNIGIVSVDVSKFKFHFQMVTPNAPDAINMFANNKELTTIHGIFDLEAVPSECSLSGMFRNCPKLYNIPNLFINYTNALPNISYMFLNCKITYLPEQMFAWDNNSSIINIPKFTFAGNLGLGNYPITSGGTPMWKFPQFYGGTITTTHAFFGCPLLKGAVPDSWGGILVKGGFFKSVGELVTLDVTGLSAITINGDMEFYEGKKSITIPADSDTQVEVEALWEVPIGLNLYVYNFGQAAVKVYDSVRFIHLGPNQGAFNGITEMPGMYFNYSVYDKVATIDNDFFVGFNSLTTLENWLKTNKVVTELPNMLPVKNTLTNITNAFNGTKIINVDNKFKDMTALTTALSAFEGSKVVSANNVFENCTNLTDGSAVLKNCKSLTSAKNIYKGCTSLIYASEAFYNCQLLKEFPVLPKESLASIVDCYYNNPNIVNVDNMFKDYSKLTRVDKVFRNCVNLESAVGVFENCPITTVLYNAFTGCKKLTNVSRAFKGTKLKRMIDYTHGIFDGNSNIEIGDECFADCPNLEYFNSSGNADYNPPQFPYIHTNVKSMRGTFRNSGLTKGILRTEGKENPNIDLDLTEVFKDCTKMTSAELSFYDDSRNIINLTSAFENCTGLTSVPTFSVNYKEYPIWELAKRWKCKQVIGTHCFRGCTNIVDFDKIPNDWK